MTHDVETQRIVLARRPVGLPRQDDFRREPVARPILREGECSVTNCFLSMDPAIRGFLDDRPSYLPPVALGGTIRGMTLGQVIRSRNARLREGVYVRALAGWEEESVLENTTLGLETVQPQSGVRLDHYLGALGPAGLTAWIGLHEIGGIKAGQTVLVSAAAGAVGSIAGQIARLRGCRSVGIVGSAEKASRIAALGFHGTIDYRSVPDLSDAVRSTCPDGVDVYFDNVGGATLEAVLPLMNVHGTVINCGMVADYNDQGNPHPVRTLWQLVVKRLTLRGFLTYEHADRIPEAQADLDHWVRNGAISALHTTYQGLDAAPGAFIDLMSGRTIGKTLVSLP